MESEKMKNKPSIVLTTSHVLKRFPCNIDSVDVDGIRNELLQHKTIGTFIKNDVLLKLLNPIIKDLDVVECSDPLTVRNFIIVTKTKEGMLLGRKLKNDLYGCAPHVKTGDS